MKIRIWPDGEFQFLLTEDTPLYYWKSDDFVVREGEVCKDCETMIVPDYDEPFASCQCGTMEWYK